MTTNTLMGPPGHNGTKKGVDERKGPKMPYVSSFLFLFVYTDFDSHEYGVYGTTKNGHEHQQLMWPPHHNNMKTLQ